MDYENKHKEEIIRATQLWECGDISRGNLEYIFPELNEDECIRKDLIKWIEEFPDSIWRGHYTKDVLAWLKRQNEQKPTNKIESKFHEGDWVVNNDTGDVFQVTEIKDDEYCLWPLYDEIMGYVRIIAVDTDYHLWTIQDAKKGDVLYNADYNNILIYKHQNGSKDFASSCRLSLNTYTFYSCEDFEWGDVIWHPATKEQRDLLFKKMHQAGYMWDANKKELKKFHVIDEGKAEMDYCFTKMMNGEKVGSAWTEEDECYMGECISAIATKDDWSFEEKRKTKHWLESIKQRMEGKV